jgi:hypothetical protein
MNNDDDCVVPPVPHRSNRLPGGQSKPRSPMLFLTFGRCSVLGAAFAHSARVAASLCANVQSLLDALEPSTVTVLLGPEALEIAALARDARTQLCVSWPVEGGVAAGGGAAAGSAGGGTGSGVGVDGAVRMETLISGVSLARFRDSQRFAASTIADALALLDSSSETVVLYFGIGDERGEAMPLLVESAWGSCQFHMWIAPRPAAE